MAAPSRRPVRWARMSFDYAIGKSPFVANSPTPASAQWSSTSPVVGSTPSHYSPPHRLPRMRTVFLSVTAIVLVVFGRLGGTSSGAKEARLGGPGAGRMRSVIADEETYRYATPSPELDPYQRHPIHDLVADARRNWDAKVARQSTTYDEATDEYRRRNHRDPPPGFDQWYAYARAHDVQLIDEFDQIAADIEPFFSLPPSEIHERIHHLGKKIENHAFLRVRDGAQVLPWTGAKWRDLLPDFFISEMAEFVSLLPDLDIPLFLHDGPFNYLDAEAKEGYLAAARAGRWVDESIFDVDGTTVWRDRSRTCLPASKLRRAEMGLENQVERSGPRFIQNHLASMDYCREPSLLHLHGESLEDLTKEAGAETSDSTGSDYMRPALSRLQPTFSLSKTSINGDILWPAPIQYDLNPTNELPFSGKPFNTLVWRGSPDGIYVGQEHNWRSSHRFRALYLTNSNDTAPTRRTRMTRRDLLGREYQLDVLASLGELNQRFMDVKATNQAVQCEEQLCDHVNSVIDFVSKASLEEMSLHRYVLDIDGNAYSARFRTHLLSNQVPLKSTRYPEWWAGRIQPWIHYVPLSESYAEIYDVMAFFTGDLSPERVGHHDGMAEHIAVAGRDWAERFWRPVDTKACKTARDSA